MNLPSMEAEASGLRRMQGRMVRTLLRQMFAQSRLRVTLVLCLSLLLWTGLFQLVKEGFVFLRTTLPQPMHEQIIEAVFNTFFFTLMLMLVFSSSVIFYGSLFRSQEIGFLLTLPIRDERIFLHRFHQAVLLSSWGFFLLGSPMLLAFGIVTGAPWYYYAMLVPLVVAFVHIPVGVGAILCLEVMYRFPRKRFHLIVLGAGLLLAAAAWFFWALASRPANDLLTPRWFQDMLGRLEMTEQRLLPNWWLSSGLQKAAGGAWAEGLLFTVLMISNALFFRHLAAWTAARVYRHAYSLAVGGTRLGRTRRRLAARGDHHAERAGYDAGTRAAWIDRVLSRLLARFRLPVRLMLLKDFRIFRRDPIQWSQFLILCGLLLLYLLNVHPFGYAIHYVGWISMVSFMNLSVVGLLMATFTTRFIFPMLSLESRRFWLLGLLPLRRESIVWSKFLFSLGCLTGPCCLLVYFSDWKLEVPWLVVGNHQLTCVILCFGLSGIAVGLGARLPNLREQAPSRIAAGFGGTLNLVVSTLYILVVMVLMTLPCHIDLATQATRGTTMVGEFSRIAGWLKPWMITGAVASLLLGGLATAVPLRIGIRAFRRLEL